MTEKIIEKIRLEYKQGTSNKFYTVEKYNASDDGEEKVPSYGVRVTWGRIGSSGQKKNQEFCMEYDRDDEFDSIVRGKKAKGYVDATPRISIDTSTTTPKVGYQNTPKKSQYPYGNNPHSITTQKSVPTNFGTVADPGQDRSWQIMDGLAGSGKAVDDNFPFYECGKTYGHKVADKLELIYTKIKKADHTALFWGLYTLSGKRVRAYLWMEGPYGPCWVFVDEKNKKTGQFAKHANDNKRRMDKLEKDGLVEKKEKAPAAVYLETTGTDFSYQPKIIVKRTDEGFPPDTSELTGRQFI